MDIATGQNRGRKMNEMDKRAIYHLRRHGWTDIQIAEHMHYSRAAIGDARRSIGVKAKRGRPRSITPMQVASIMELHSQGLGYRVISARMNLGRSTVRSIIRRETKKHDKIPTA
jgi:DNA-binding NarL/FixJ family response regulator